MITLHDGSTAQINARSPKTEKYINNIIVQFDMLTTEKQRIT